VKTATLHKVIDKNKVVFKLSEPIECFDSYDEDNNYEPIMKLTDYVVSSKAKRYFETYIFSGDENGNITSWSELAGSEKDIYNFSKPLINAGYKVVVPPAFKLLFKE